MASLSESSLNVAPGDGGAARMQHDRREPRVFRWVDRVTDAAGYVAGLCILVAAALICWAIIARAFAQTATWQLEASIYLLIVVTFLGAAYGARHQHHIRIDLFVNRLPARAAAAVEMVVTLSVIALVVFVGLRGLEMTTTAYEEGHTSGTAWNVDLYLPYATLPLGMLLLAAQYSVELCRAALRFRANEKVLSERDQLAPSNESQRWTNVDGGV